MICAEKKGKSTVRVDDCLRSWILTVAFDRSEREKGKKVFREMCVTQDLVCPHTHHSESGAYHHFQKDVQEDREQEGTKESHQRPSARK